MKKEEPDIIQPAVNTSVALPEPAESRLTVPDPTRPYRTPRYGSNLRCLQNRVLHKNGRNCFLGLHKLAVVSASLFMACTLSFIFPASMFGVLLLSASVAVSQEHPAIAAEPNTVFVSADGKFEAPPDLAIVQFNISAQAATAKAAYEQASKQAERTREILRDNGLEPRTAEIGSYAIQPRYDWKTPSHKLIGYEVTVSVTIKLKDFSKIGPITQQLADSAVGEGQSLNYTLENIDAAKSKAVADAYRHARMSAETIAQLSGRVLGELSYASVDTFENIRPLPVVRQMAMSQAQSEVTPPTQEFTPGNVTVTAHVNAVFNLK